MEKSSSYAEISELIKSSPKVVVISHESPDPDAYGSSLALTLAIEKLGKEVTVVNATGIVADLNFLPNISKIQKNLPDLTDCLVITTDSAGLSRLGKDFSEKLLAHGVDINIDHHISNEYFAKHNLIEELSSCSEMIFKLIQELKIEIDSEIANLLLAGIYSDTGSLQYKGVNSETFRVVAKLMESGADLQTFVQKLFQEKSLAVLRLQSRMIEQVNLLFNDQFAYIVIPESWIQEFGTNHDQLHHVKDIFRNIAGVKISATIREDQGVWKASLRSIDPVDVNKISQPLGGGGHAQAAGIKWKKDLTEFIEKLIAGVESELQAKKCI